MLHPELVLSRVHVEAGLALLHGLDGIVDELSREAPVLLLESRPHSCHSSPKLRGAGLN